jgi:ABC-type transport system involved in cytochrome bd biosynthesis fused ATPase/permease subunit
MNKHKKTIIKFLLNNKFSVFILFVLPILNIIFNSWIFSKYMGLTFKHLGNNNLIEARKYILLIILIVIILQFLRYIQRMFLSKFLEKINDRVKINTFHILTELSVSDSQLYSEHINKLGDEIVETINMIYSFIYKPFCSLIVGILIMLFINGILGRILLMFGIIFLLSFKYLIKTPLDSIEKLEKEQINNKLFINDICRNAFLEKILNLKSFTNNLFKNKIINENKCLKNKYDSIARCGLYSNLICQITFGIMLFTSIFLDLPVEMKIAAINLIINFFSEFNEVPNQIVPLLSNIGRIKENMKVLYVATEIEKENIKENITNIKINNLYFFYEENNPIISNLSTEFKKGLYALQGESGKGKSTLLQIIMGIKSFNKGEILINNINVKNKNILNNISYLSQFDYVYNRTVEENLSMNKNIDNIKKEIISYKMGSILNNKTGINGESISGGQCKRLCFLRMLNFHKKGNLIILDEPFNGLDKSMIQLILDFIKENISSSIIIIIDHTASYINIEFTPIVL